MEDKIERGPQSLTQEQRRGHRTPSCAVATGPRCPFSAHQTRVSQTPPDSATLWGRAPKSRGDKGRVILRLQGTEKLCGSIGSGCRVTLRGPLRMSLRVPRLGAWGPAEGPTSTGWKWPPVQEAAPRDCNSWTHPPRKLTKARGPCRSLTGSSSASSGKSRLKEPCAALLGNPSLTSNDQPVF